MGDYELYHAATRKHKYIKKIGKRYFYTQQEIAAYLKEKKGQAEYAKEAVAEATGQRDVYWEAPKVTENGHTFYDDEASELRTGNVRKRKDVVKTNKDGEYADVYTKNSNLYENQYTKEQNAKTRARGRKKLKKMATRPVRSLKNQAARGKKKLESIYKPKSTVKVVDRIDGRTGKHF